MNMIAEIRESKERGVPGSVVPLLKKGAKMGGHGRRGALHGAVDKGYQCSREIGGVKVFRTQRNPLAQHIRDTDADRRLHLLSPLL